MFDNDINPQGNFACTVELVAAENSAYARLHVGSQDFSWEHSPVTIEYLSLYISLELEGSEFDAMTLKNTENVAVNNVVKQVHQDEQELKESGGASLNVGLGAKGPTLDMKVEEGSSDGIKHGQSTEGQYVDLMWNLQNRDGRRPKWKVSLRNPNSLSLSQKSKTRLGIYKRLEAEGEMCIKGHAWTGPKGVGFRVILGDLPIKYRMLGGHGLWRQIIERRIEKYIADTRIPIEQVMS